MNFEYSELLALFERFATSQGLRLVEKRQSSWFGDRFVTYGDDTLHVRMGKDRSVGFIEISEVVTRPGHWYNPALIYGFLFGNADDGPRSLPDQVRLIADNWEAIVNAFSVANREQSHEKFRALGREMITRRIPGLFGGTQ